MLVFFFFFFSSRRRHTRLQGDWSSDVCSSDLTFPRRAGSTVDPTPWTCGIATPTRPSRRSCTPDRNGSSAPTCPASRDRDRKSTRLNSSHLVISYAVFCLKKKRHNNNCSTCSRALDLTSTC